MQKISELLKLEKPKYKSERAELLAFFHERLKDKAGKPFNIAFLAFKLAHLKVEDLRHLLSICRQSNNFSKTFFGALKVK